MSEDARPLLVFDTNILVDVLLGRDGASAVLLVKLAETHRASLVLPEYVLHEFRGTALRWIRSERTRLHQVRQSAKEWSRTQELDGPADNILEAANRIAERLEALTPEVDEVIKRVSAVATVEPHTQNLHFLGDIRYLKGLPPDRPVDGLKDCRIYEAILAIGEKFQTQERPKFLVTKDSDFSHPELKQELRELGFEIRSDPGRLYGEYI